MSQPRTLLAFDFGELRIGVAVGNTLTGAARPLDTIASVPVRDRFATIGRLIAQWEPDALVVGRPLQVDSEPIRMTALAERFARQLSGRFGLPVHAVDERFSSAQAEDEGARGAAIDAQAAAIILRQYMDEDALRAAGAPAADPPPATRSP